MGQNIFLFAIFECLDTLELLGSMFYSPIFLIFFVLLAFEAFFSKAQNSSNRPFYTQLCNEDLMPPFLSSNYEVIEVCM